MQVEGTLVLLYYINIIGIPMAIFNVGVHYFAGKGVAPSFDKAKEYFLRASDRGFVPAQVGHDLVVFGD